MSSNLDNAKNALDSIIKKSRVHLYKPIQIAEILYKNRKTQDVNDLTDLESYRHPIESLSSAKIRKKRL